MNTHTLILIGTLMLLIVSPCIQAEETIPPTLTLLSPKENSLIYNQTPTILIEYVDNSGIDSDTVRIIFDMYDITEWEETDITSTSITYNVPPILKLQNGTHTITVEVQDIHGNRATQTWSFSVEPSSQMNEDIPFDLSIILFYIIYGAIISIVVFLIIILFLKKTRKFTFRKFFVKHPIKKEIFTVFIPLIIGFFVIIFGILWAIRALPDMPFAPEYIFTIGLFIAIGPHTMASIAEKRRIDKYEQAFAQFLFEMADAMRGGLDPTKAIIELAKANEGILKDHLKKAAENIQLGRPLDEVMNVMVRHSKSDLVKRYATLIGNASKIGGETSLVIYRTAKDMDDFIKINHERRRHLTTQITTIYIAFAVLLIILYQLITMFPSLGSINISLLGSSGLESTTTASVITRMSVETMKRRFLHLMIINSIGTGTLMGMLIDGKIKYGLIHSLILTAVSVVFFALLIL
jgi:pilus assembly protein TadC